MGTALTAEQAHALRRLAPSVLLCQDPDAAGQEAVAKALEVMRARRRARGARRPAAAGAATRPTSSQQDGPDAMRALLDGAVPVERFQVERALERGGARDARGPRPGAGRGRADDRAGWGPGCCRTTSSGWSPTGWGCPRASRRTRCARVPRGGATAAAAATAAGTRRRRRGVTSVDKLEDVERAFLARCLAVKGAGRRGARGDGPRRHLLHRPRPPRRPLPRPSTSTPRPVAAGRRRRPRPPGRRARHPLRRARRRPRRRSRSSG